MQEKIAYFGYGSLVNRATLRTHVLDAMPARLSGWRRCWRTRPNAPDFSPALLSVRPDDGAEIDGLLILDRAEHLPAVDLREANYERRPVSPHRLAVASLTEAVPLYIYEAKSGPVERRSSHILQSYLDAVLQGFLREHGAEAVERFIAETEGFDLPILPDRARPVYPRAVRLTADEERLFDRLLDAAGVARLAARP